LRENLRETLQSRKVAGYAAKITCLEAKLASGGGEKVCYNVYNINESITANQRKDKKGRGILMRIAVCDDCPEDMRQIKNYLVGHTVGTYLRAAELLTDVEEKGVHFDLYLLDIYMEDSMNGIELAERIRSLDADAVFCFVSTSSDFYREAYDLYAIQYLLKPVQRKDVLQLLDRVSKSLVRDREQSLFFKWNGGTGKIPYGKILFISSRGHILSIFCKDGMVQKCTGTLNELELKICGDVFCRCHQSFLINLYHVECLSGKELVISGSRIPISRRYYEQVKSRYREVLFEEVE